MNTSELTSKHWFGRASAGLLLGFTFAVGVSAWISWFGPGGLEAGSGKVQFVMWIVAPLWVTVLSTSFLFHSGKRAWTKLGLLNLLCFGGLFIFQYLLG